MTCQLLPWLLATVLGAVSGEIGDGPDDPYLWLEEVAGEKPLSWVKERNAESTGELTRSDRFRALEHRLLAILDSDARIPDIQKVGPFYYNFWRDAKNRRGLWRRTTMDEYRKDKPDWEIVLDLDALAKRRGRTGSGTGRRRCGPNTRSPWSRCLAAGPTRPSSASSTWRRSRSSRTATRCPRPRAGSPGAMLTASSWAPTSARAR